LRQILTNLVGNAIKFTNQGEVVVKVSRLSPNPTFDQILSPEPNASQSADQAIQRGPNQSESIGLRFSIRDTGMGIPPEKLGLLFNKFSQVDVSTTRHFGGTGLGLAISKQLAELMGGEIGINSVTGQGSEFWFTIYLGVQPVKEQTAQDEMPVVANLNGIRVLIVDDNATSREILTRRLASWGMRSMDVDSGAAALQILSAEWEQGDPFQVVLLDMQMPGMDGAQVGKAIKSDENLASTHLLLLSSIVERGDARRFEAIGFNGYCPSLFATPTYSIFSLPCLPEMNRRQNLNTTSHCA
jgi:CheY-like chemotaxis protein